MGWAFSVFGWAYALFEIPGGWLGDRHRPAPRPDAHRDLVVVLHRGDRLGLEFRVAARDARSLFGAGEAGCFPEPDPDLHDLAAAARARAGAGDPVAQRALGRRVHAAARRLRPRLRDLAARLRALRRCSASSGRSRFTAGIATIRARTRRSTPRSWRCCRRARESAVGARPIPWARSCRKPSGLAAVRSSTSASVTAGSSTSPGCRPICGKRAARSLKLGALLAGLPLFLGGVGCLVSGCADRRVSPGRPAASARAADRRDHRLCRRLRRRSSCSPGSGSDAGDARARHGRASSTISSCRPRGPACMDMGGRYSGTVSGA